ncbi:kinase-like domain, phloem protein 2-like protein [Tanacetum coccineum]
MMSSPNHLLYLKIPLKKILSVTNNFDDKNIIGRGEFEKRYTGQLFCSGELIKIIARRWLNKERNDREQVFWMNIFMLSSLKHKNLVSLIGFCDENDEKIIIYKDERRGSLSNHLSNTMALTWTEASQRHHSFHTNIVKGVTGYVDPTYLETKSVNHKSDMYSFGIVMFELLCDRESIITHNNNKCLAPLAVTHYRENRLDEIIDWDLWKQMNQQSFNILAEAVYDCLNEERSQCPNIDEIVLRLEKALELQLKPENYDNSIGEGTSSSFIHKKVS